jgi:hypothetical protein
MLDQNYFSFQDQLYQPEKGVAMGSPISGTIAEIFLQHLENIHIKHLDTKNIVFYSRYVDDILIMYNSTCTNPNAINTHINQIHSNLHLSPTYENMEQISFLDLSMIRKTPKLEMDIFRKPTTTDATINYYSNHPTEHKLAAYQHYIERMLLLPLTNDWRLSEWKTI